MPGRQILSACLKSESSMLYFKSHLPRILSPKATPSNNAKLYHLELRNEFITFHIFQFNFSSLKGKVVLVENTASLWGTTTRDFKQMNELCEKYGDKLVSKSSIFYFQLQSLVLMRLSELRRRRMRPNFSIIGIVLLLWNVKANISCWH